MADELDEGFENEVDVLDDFDEESSDVVSWKPHKEKDLPKDIRGVVTSVKPFVWDGEAIPAFTLRTEGAEPVTYRVVAFHKVLRDKIEESKIWVGDRARVAHLGKPQGKNYENYALKSVRTKNSVEPAKVAENQPTDW